MACDWLVKVWDAQLYEMMMDHAFCRLPVAGSVSVIFAGSEVKSPILAAKKPKIDAAWQKVAASLLNWDKDDQYPVFKYSSDTVSYHWKVLEISAEEPKSDAAWGWMENWPLLRP